MKSLLARSGRAGASGSPYQPSLGAYRRPTAAPLRIQKQNWQLLVATQHSSAPTQTPNDLEATEAAMRAAKERMAANGQPTLPKPVIAEAEDLKAKFAKIQAEVSSYRALSVENGKLEEDIARLRQENQELVSKLEAQQAELQRAVAVVREEVAGPLQQQLEELSMQLQNAQAQLERLGEAVEAAESDKALAIEAAESEKARAIEAAESEKARAIEAAESEKARAIEAAESEKAMAIQAAESEKAMAIQAAESEKIMAIQAAESEKAMAIQAAELEMASAMEAVESEKAAAIQALREENAELLLALEGATRRLAEIVYPPGSLPAGLTVSARLEGSVDLQAAMEQRRAAAAAGDKGGVAVGELAQAATAGPSPAATQPQLQPQPQAGFRVGSFFAKVLGFVCFWLYHVLGALLLYYAAAILRGAPPTLNVEFGLGCLLVCTLLPWANRLLVPRFSA